MAIPSKKDRLLEHWVDEQSFKQFGISRTVAILDDICIGCKSPAVEFHDELSKREYTISGFCQTCQDKLSRED